MKAKLSIIASTIVYYGIFGCIASAVAQFMPSIGLAYFVIIVGLGLAWYIKRVFHITFLAP